MTGNLAALFAMAAWPERAVLCVQHLAGEEPYVTGVGHGPPAPRLCLSFVEYRRLVADLRACFVVEAEETVGMNIVTSGKHFLHALERPTTRPQMLSGYLNLGPRHCAASWMVDSVGQEVITIYRDVASSADVEAYWETVSSSL